jgi:hypothetical protein
MGRIGALGSIAASTVGTVGPVDPVDTTGGGWGVAAVHAALINTVSTAIGFMP